MRVWAAERQICVGGSEAKFVDRGMAANYLPYEPEQMLLLPEALQDWLPEGHVVHFISDAVDGLDLGAFHARYDKDDPGLERGHHALCQRVQGKRIAQTALNPLSRTDPATGRAGEARG